MFPPKGFPLKHLYTDMQMYKSDVQKYKENKDKEKREKKLKIWLFKQKKKHAEKPVVPVSNQEARMKEAEKRRAMKKVSVRIPGAPIIPENNFGIKEHPVHPKPHQPKIIPLERIP